MPKTHTQADQVEQLVRESGGELKRAEILKEVSFSESRLDNVLTRLVNEGRLSREGQGLYTLPKNSHNGGVKKTSTPTVESSDELIGLLESTVTMVIHTSAKVSAGDGKIIYPSDSTRKVEAPKGLLSEVLGFHPPSRIGITRAQGDSMKPTIRDGELVIWEPVSEIASAGLYVLHLTHGSVVKRVQPFPDGSYRVISDNDYDDYENVTLVPTDSGELIQDSTGRVAEMHPVGRVLFPDRSTDQMHVKQVSELISRLVTQDNPL